MKPPRSVKSVLSLGGAIVMVFPRCPLCISIGCGVDIGASVVKLELAKSSS